MKQIQVQIQAQLKKTLFEKITKAEIEFDLMAPIRRIGQNVNRAD
jgi:hypothetical protein